MSVDPVLHPTSEDATLQGRGPKSPELPLLLSPEQAASELSISRWSVYKEIREGRLRSLLYGRRRLIAKEELFRFIREELAA
jgi:excisionase family DNA binding protein